MGDDTGTDLRQQCGFKDESDLFWMQMNRMLCADAGSKPLIVEAAVGRVLFVSGLGMLPLIHILGKGGDW